jgi:hypothetical protein
LRGKGECSRKVGSRGLSVRPTPSWVRSPGSGFGGLGSQAAQFSEGKDTVPRPAHNTLEDGNVFDVAIEKGHAESRPTARL